MRYSAREYEVNNPRNSSLSCNLKLNTIIDLISGHLYEENEAHYPTFILAYPDAAKRPFRHLANHYLQIASSPLARNLQYFRLSSVLTIKTLSALGSDLADKGLFYFANHGLL